MAAPPPDELALTALFLQAKDAAEVRAQLGLAEHLGEKEGAFHHAVALVFERLRREPAGAEGLHYKAGWLELFNQAVRELRAVLVDVRGRQ